MADTPQEQVKNWRKTVGWTQGEVGEMIGDRGGAQLSKWEIGARTLPPRLAVELAKISGVPLGDLLTDEQADLFRTACRLMGAANGG